MKKGLLLAIFLVCCQSVSFAENSDFPAVFWNKITSEKAIAITVDDCNNPGLVGKMADIANEYGVRLTFFPTGKNVLSWPDLWKKIYRQGHQIELHTFSHKKMNCGKKEQTEEIVRNIAAIRSVLGSGVKFSFLRLPYGVGLEEGNRSELYFALREAAKVNGGPIEISMWETDLLFIKGKLGSSRQVLDEFKSNLHPGNVFLFHGRKEEVVHFEEMVALALERGFSIMAMGELFSAELKGLVEKRKTKDGQKNIARWKRKDSYRGL